MKEVHFVVRNQESHYSLEIEKTHLTILPRKTNQFLILLNLLDNTLAMHLFVVLFELAQCPLLYLQKGQKCYKQINGLGVIQKVQEYQSIPSPPT